MADIWLGRFSRGIEKLFNVKGGPSIVDVEPSVRLAYPISPPVEERYLFGVETFGAGSVQAAVAANKSAFMIRNPLGSNVVTTIEKLSVFSSASAPIVLVVAGSNPADLATPIAPHNRVDPRHRSTPSSIVSQDAPAVDPTTGFLFISQEQVGSASLDFILYANQEIVLLPQMALRAVCQTVNQNLAWTCWFRERPLESSELA